MNFVQKSPEGSVMTDLEWKTNSSRFFVDVVKEGIVVVRTVFYPGWEVKVDKEKVALTQPGESGGLIGFNVPLGKHFVEIKWEETPFRKMANLITLSTFLVTVGYLIKKLWQRFI